MSETQNSKQPPPPEPPPPPPPARPDIERIVLAVILRDHHLPTSLNIADFSLDDHRKVFRRMLDIVERDGYIDRITTAEELATHKDKVGKGEILSFLLDLDVGVPDVANLDEYVAILKGYGMRRRILDETDIVRTKARRETEDLDEVLAEGSSAFARMQAERNHKEEAPTTPSWPEPLHEDAFHGVVGDLVRAIAPQSEADPVALLLQFLVGFGNMAGRGPYIAVEGDRHHTNEYAVLVGISSIARKGTSWGRVRGAYEAVDQHWVDNCLLGGIGSGEALIESLGDADHRRLVLEPEFARVLAVIAREGATLSAVFRQCWDSGTADIKVRGKGEVHARGAHLSAICHITKDELLRKLSGTELANGFANRFLFACVARSQELPFGGDSIHYGDALKRLFEATDHARKLGNTPIKFDREARALWAEKYHDLTAGRPGLFGDLIARRAPHVLRLSLNYGLLDCANEIRVEHLRAGLAVWHYCEQSALYIWGNALGDATADELLRALRATGAEGMTQWDITNHFGRNKPAAEIYRAIGVLAERGLIRSDTQDTGGRPSTGYWAV